MWLQRKSRRCHAAGGRHVGTAGLASTDARRFAFRLASGKGLAVVTRCPSTAVNGNFLGPSESASPSSPTAGHHRVNIFARVIEAVIFERSRPVVQIEDPAGFSAIPGVRKREQLFRLAVVKIAFDAIRV